MSEIVSGDTVDTVDSSTWSESLDALLIYVLNFNYKNIICFVCIYSVTSTFLSSVFAYWCYDLSVIPFSDYASALISTVVLQFTS